MTGAYFGAYFAIVKLALERARESWRELCAIAAVVVLGNWLTAAVLNMCRTVYRGENPLRTGVHVCALDFSATGIVPIVAISLVVEARILGWEASSLKRLFDCKTTSVRTDLFYLVLNCANLHLLLGFFFSLGAGYWLQLRMQDAFGWKLLKDAPLGAAFIVQWFVGSLVFFAQHRVQHTRFLWEFHKIHHAAEDMDLANNFRSHPLMITMRTVMETLPGAVLGINPGVLLAYSAAAGVIVIWQHSDVDWNLPVLERYVAIGARGHRIHHSRFDRHFSKNMGFFVFWDWLFGTLLVDESARSAPIGILDPLHNRRGAAREMLLVQASGVRTFAREAGAWAAGPGRPPDVERDRGPSGSSS